MLLIRVMKITSLLFLAMTVACNSGSTGVPESAGVTGVSGVDADGLFGVVRKTYYHLDSPTTASIVDIPVAATKAQRYTFDSSLGLKAEGEISLDLIRASVDGKSYDVRRIRGRVPRLSAARLHSRKPLVKYASSQV